MNTIIYQSLYLKNKTKTKQNKKNNGNSKTALVEYDITSKVKRHSIRSTRLEYFLEVSRKYDRIK